MLENPERLVSVGPLNPLTGFPLWYNGVPGGSYVVTYPFGETGPLIADDRGRVFVTEDIGVAPLQFDGALAGHVAPFLQWTSGAAKDPGEADPPAGYLGDGSIAHTITGSPLGTIHAILAYGIFLYSCKYFIWAYTRCSQRFRKYCLYIDPRINCTCGNFI